MGGGGGGGVGTGEVSPPDGSTFPKKNLNLPPGLTLYLNYFGRELATMKNDTLLLGGKGPGGGKHSISLLGS